VYRFIVVKLYLSGIGTLSNEARQIIHLNVLPIKKVVHVMCLKPIV